MVKEIRPSELAQRQAGGQLIYLVDVRQPWEHETAALPNSHLLSLHEVKRRYTELKPPEGALVVVYCHHGVRSLAGAALLEAVGFRSVMSLAGGIDAWSREVDPAVPRY